MLILVVDDHDLNRRLMTMLLEDDGHEVIGAGSVREIHTRLADTTPDIILMDIHLPDGDGLDVVRELRGDARFAGVKMFAVTANLMSESGERARRAGCDGFFEKPLDTTLLLDTVRR